VGANAWDADAHEVTIDIGKEKDQIVVKDDGIGMNEEDINRRYLNVG
jgi:DNA mismatch repair ATPase MutL